MFGRLSALKAMGKREAARAATLVAAGVLALAILVLGAVFLALSFHLWLTERIGAPLAALGTAAAAFLLAFTVLLVARLATGRKTKARAKDKTEEDLAAALGPACAASFSATVKEHGVAAAAATLLAGVAVGASPNLRKALLDLLKQWTRA
ncbi:MAG: hypothetical protein U1E87_05560 [Alphaproteobacteria bacterium]